MWLKQKIVFEMLDSYSRVSLGSCLLGGHALSSDDCLRAFRENMVPSSLMVKQTDKNVLYPPASKVELNSTPFSPVARLSS